MERSAPLLLRLNLASRAAYLELTGKLGSFGLLERGVLMLCRSKQGLATEANLAQQARALGLDARVLDPAALRQLEPNFDLSVAGAVHYADDAHLDPGLMQQALQDTLISVGVEFLWHTSVTGARREGERIAALSTSRGEVVTDEVVLAAGVWSSELAAGLGLKLPQQAGKGYSLTLPGRRRNLQRPPLLSEARVAVTPLASALRIGGTMELAGTVAGVNTERAEGIIASALQYFPELSRQDFADLPVWHGFRPCSPDGLPNLIVATEHSMLGISLGPVTDELVASLAASEELPADLNLLHPDRYR